MQATIDGKPLDGAGRTLGTALAAAITSAGDRLIIEAIADGVPVPHDDIDHPPDREPYADSISFTTAKPEALIKVTLHEAADSLEAIASWQSEAGAEVQSGRIEQAMPIAGRVLEGWRSIREAIDLIAQSGMLGELDRDATFISMNQALVQTLTQLKRSLEQQDWSTVGDTLAYDLSEEAERWRDWLRARAETQGSVE